MGSQGWIIARRGAGVFVMGSPTDYPSASGPRRRRRDCCGWKRASRSCDPLGSMQTSTGLPLSRDAPGSSVIG
ncbi:hypothetical protein [uncultured Roseobacter sp.]|uniref:hypothetical protein n=1 Tax=uncultured Roseobacter sp. TaxID=114847 RepID=UPI0034166694